MTGGQNMDSPHIGSNTTLTSTRIIVVIAGVEMCNCAEKLRSCITGGTMTPNYGPKWPV